MLSVYMQIQINLQLGLVVVTEAVTALSTSVGAEADG